MNHHDLRKLACIPACFAMLAASPANAEEASGEEGAKSPIAELIEALGAPETSGETTLETNAGTIESTIMAAWAANSAAAKIAEFVQLENSTADYASPAGTKSILVLTGTSTTTITDDALFQRATDLLLGSSDQVIATYCPTQPGGTAAFLPPAGLTALSSVLSLLRTDTTVKGFTIANLDDALASSLAGHLDRSIMPGDVVSLDPGNPIVQKFDALSGRQSELRAMLPSGGTDGVCPQTGATIKLAKEGVDAVKAAIASNEAFLAGVVKRPTGGGLSPLERAATAAAIGDDVLVLRVQIVQAGGSIIERSNLWTTLGAPAIGLTGGIVAHFSLVDPESQEVKSAGIVVCGTEKASFARVHENNPESICSVNGQLTPTD